MVTYMTLEEYRARIGEARFVAETMEPWAEGHTRRVSGTDTDDPPALVNDRATDTKHAMVIDDLAVVDNQCGYSGDEYVLDGNPYDRDDKDYVSADIDGNSLIPLLLRYTGTRNRNQRVLTVAEEVLSICLVT